MLTTVDHDQQVQLKVDLGHRWNLSAFSKFVFALFCYIRLLCKKDIQHITFLAYFSFVQDQAKIRQTSAVNKF